MNSNLLTELQQIMEKEKSMKRKLPVPDYLFVQRYGREITDEMNEIAALFGDKEWFLFCTERKKREETLRSYLQLELERRGGVGKEFSGSILIELSGNEEEHDLEEVFSYFSRQKQQYHCIYTVKAGTNTEYIKTQLAKTGFIRVVQGAEYDTSEQMEIFGDTLERYQFRLTKEAEDYIVHYFEKMKWKETDAVKVRIQNIAKEIVYNRLIKDEVSQTEIEQSEVEQVLQLSNATEKRQIGFAVREVEL